MTRRALLKTTPAFLAGAAASQQAAPRRPHQATGFKICEVDQTSAIIWTRLTRNRQRVGKGGPMPLIRYRDARTGELQERRSGRPSLSPVVDFPNGSTVDTIEGAAPGAAGEVQVRYKRVGGEWRRSRWQAVDPERDFTAQIKLEGLEPHTAYEVEVRSRNGETGGETLRGRFQTAPAAESPERVVFTVTTGTSYNDQDHPRGGFKMYGHMLGLDPSFFVHTGDIIYYDRQAKTLPLARWHWQRMYSLRRTSTFTARSRRTSSRTTTTSG